MESPISVICIQESWAHEGIEMSQFFLPNYTMIFENRRLSTHGGLIMYTHDDFAYKELNKEITLSSTSNFSSENLELILISVYTSINDTSELLLIYRFIGGHMISTCTLFFMVSMTQHLKFVLSHYINVLLIL